MSTFGRQKSGSWTKGAAENFKMWDEKQTQQRRRREKERKRRH